MSPPAPSIDPVLAAVVPPDPLPMPPATPQKRAVNVPVGTIRFDVTSRGRFVRRIKVRMRGEPTSARWLAYARWWWLTHKGPIPEGMCVLHRDGDTLNDDPSNFVLGTHADQAFINHDRDPEMSEENYRKMRIGAAKSNALRGRVKRATAWLPWRWYPVDHAGGVVHNVPCKSRYQVWHAVGRDVTCAINGALCDAAALGWQGRTLTQALILTALAEGEKDTPAMVRRMNWLRTERGEPKLMSLAPVYSAMVVLHHLGLVRTTRRGRRQPALHAITPAALAQRGLWTSVVPVRGRDITRGVCDGYLRIDEENQLRVRVGDRGRLLFKEAV